MTAVALAFVASVAWGISDVLAGAVGRRASVFVLMLVALPVGCLVILPPLAGRPLPSTETFAIAAAAGVADLLALAMLYRALAVGPLGVVSPVTGLAPLVPLAYGLTRGESLAPAQAAGVVVALVGLVLVGREPRHDASRHVPFLGLGLALGSAIAGGVTQVAIAQASRGDPYWTSLVLRVSSFLILLPIVGALRPRLRLGRRTYGAMALVGLLDAGGMVFFAVATTHGLLSLVSVIGGLYPLTVVATGRLVLGERLSRHQAVGAAAAVAGAALISAG